MADNLNTARSSTSSSSASLSFQQSSELNSRKDVIRDEHLSYVNQHPELKRLLSDFLSEVLLVKPQDIHTFASDYFASFLPKEKTVHPLVIVGPSGVGKGTLVKRLFSEFGANIGLSVSHTTRNPREGEQDGVHYHFSDMQTMQDQIDKGLFIEHAQVHGNLYGTSFEAVETVCQRGQICILEIDVQGVKSIDRTDFRSKKVYIAPPSLDVLEKRLRDRASESEEELKCRLENAKTEMAWLETPGNVDQIVVNDDLETAYQNLVGILKEWYPQLVSSDAATESKE